MSSSDSKIPVWLDCDPGKFPLIGEGHDDAFAIVLAAHHPSLELLGVSTVHGNSSIANTTENAGRILTAIGRPEVPVYPGSEKGLIRPAVHAAAIHGESGIDGTALLPDPLIPPILDIFAVDAIAKALFATPPNTSWLIATGTLTNIALVFIKFPKLASHIRGLSIMGGSVGGGFTNAPLGMVDDQERFGNWSPYAEFNIVCDPEAAESLFSNPILAVKTTLIPLDVTHLVLATTEVQELLLHGPNNIKTPPPSTLRVMLMELMNFFASTYVNVFGIAAGPPLHDPLAVAAVLDGIMGVQIPFHDFLSVDGKKGEIERFSVKVVTEGTHEEAMNGITQTGRTIVKLLETGQEGIKIPRSLDVSRFWTVLEECIHLADLKNAENLQLKVGTM